MGHAVSPRRCHICEGTDVQGVTLVHGFICAQCLENISATEVSDSRYAFYVDKLKQLWQVG